jgi:hypothetical protein
VPHVQRYIEQQRAQSQPQPGSVSA